MTKYRKLPVEVSAVQFKTLEDQQAAFEWAVLNSSASGRRIIIRSQEDDPHILIETLEGTMRVSEGDWIIKGVAGELYPCKDKIFQQTYEKVD